MSTESNRVVDQQPKSTVLKDCYGSGFEVLGSLQTTDDRSTQQAGFPTLDKLSNLEVVQRLDTLEVLLCWTRNNRYCIYNEEGEQLFYVYEVSVCFNRAVTGALRELTLKVSLSVDDEDDVVFLRRRRGCSSRCCWACCDLQHMDLVLPSGSVLASVQEVWTCWVPEYHITDSTGQHLYTVKGGACHCRCCFQLQFQFMTANGTEAARVTRSCQGCKELIGAANKFSIDFGDTLSPQQKLIVLGASFLVDLNYFEKQNKCW